MPINFKVEYAGGLEVGTPQLNIPAKFCRQTISPLKKAATQQRTRAQLKASVGLPIVSVSGSPLSAAPRGNTWHKIEGVIASAEGFCFSFFRSRIDTRCRCNVNEWS